MQQATLTIAVRRLVIVAAGFSLLLGFLLVAQGWIDTKDYREQIVRVLKEKTGKDVIIKGNVLAKLLPRPALFVPGMEFRSEKDQGTAPELTIEAVYINVAVLSFFSDHLQVSSVILEKPSLEVQRLEDGAVNWGWLNGVFEQMRGMLNEETPSVLFEIINGKIVYNNNVANRNVVIRSLNMKGGLGSNPVAEGVFQWGLSPIRFDIGAEKDDTFHAKFFTDAGDELLWQGILDNKSELLKIHGDFAATLSNVLPWITGEAGRKEQASLPVKLTGSWAQEGWTATIDKLKFDGMNSIGEGKASLSWDNKPAITAEMQFSKIYYSPWQALMAAVSAQLQPSDDLYKEDTGQTETILSKNIKISLKAAADELVIGEQSWKHATLFAVLDDAAITVNQLNAELPDAAALTAFGIISQGSSRNLRFEGNFESQGKSLRKLLTIFDATAAELPEAALGNFFIHSNIFISPEQVRLSEADLAINELKLAGGLVAYFDAKPRIEADVKLEDINFDYFRDTWRQAQKDSDTKEFFLLSDKNFNFNWLKKLATNIDFKVVVDRFTFFERQGESAAFRIFAEQGEFGIYNMRFYYPNEVMEATFKLDVKNNTPFINLLFNTPGAINTDYFIGSTNKDEPKVDVDDSEEKQRWSKDLITMRWMEGYNGIFDISVGALSHGGKLFNRFKMKSQLANRQLTITALGFDYWQGHCEVTGTLYGGNVPGLSVGFTLTNVDLKDIVSSFSSRDNISGKLGASGSLATSGVNLHSWVSQAEAKLVLNGVGINVNNFNLQGVVDTVAVSRTTADVVNNINRVLLKGNTEFSMEGYLNVKNGIVKTPGLTLKSGKVIGNLTGDIKLVPWAMNLSTLFQFPAMTSETVPTMTVTLVGAVEHPELQTDTDSLEAYVSKRIVGR